MTTLFQSTTFAVLLHERLEQTAKLFGMSFIFSLQSQKGSVLAVLAVSSKTVSLFIFRVKSTSLSSSDDESLELFVNTSLETSADVLPVSLNELKI